MAISALGCGAYPEELNHKLLMRRAFCFQKLEDRQSAEEALQAALVSAQQHGVPDDKVPHFTLSGFRIRIRVFWSNLYKAFLYGRVQIMFSLHINQNC